MKTPGRVELEKAYHLLRLENPDEKKWILYAEWVRFEPRLGEMWLHALSRWWKQLNPVALQKENLKRVAPASLGVLLDQCGKFLIQKEDRALFKAWKQTVLSGVKIANGENFFIGLHDFASRGLQDEIRFASRIYRRWGFGGRDTLINKFAEKQKSFQKSDLSPEIRFNILKSLLKKRSRITVEDYIQSCDFRISRRLAQLDLFRHPRLRAHGNTRGRYYTLSARL